MPAPPLTSPKITTPAKLIFPDDIRKDSRTHDIHNTWIKKTRSGHVIELNDNKGVEHVTIQHRSGSLIQFQPDGAVVISSSNGQFQITYGENRIYVTGARDIVVDGDASLKVKGDYNVTVDGDYNLSIGGNLTTVVAKNRHDVILKNEQKQVIGNVENKVGGFLKTTIKGSIYFGTSDSVKISGSTATIKGDSLTEILSDASIDIEAPDIDIDSI